MVEFRIILIFLISECIIEKVLSKCSFTQDCEDSNDPACFPYKVDKEAVALEYDDVACPEFRNKPVCCSKAQDKILSKCIGSIF